MVETPQNHPGAGVSPTSPLPLIRSPEYRVVYANAYRLNVTVSDASVTFLHQTEFPNVPTQVLQEQTTVVLTLPALKLLSLQLQKIIAAAESVLGPIRVPTAAIARDDQLEPLVENLRNTPLTE